jgi:hypothetical protein
MICIYAGESATIETSHWLSFNDSPKLTNDSENATFQANGIMLSDNCDMQPGIKGCCAVFCRYYSALGLAVGRF